MEKKPDPITEYLDSYEFRGDPDHVPTPEERLLIEDAMRGYEAEREEALYRALHSRPVVKVQIVAPEEVEFDLKGDVIFARCPNLAIDKFALTVTTDGATQQVAWMRAANSIGNPWVAVHQSPGADFNLIVIRIKK